MSFILGVTHAGWALPKHNPKKASFNSFTDFFFQNYSIIT